MQMIYSLLKPMQYILMRKAQYGSIQTACACATGKQFATSDEKSWTRNWAHWMQILATEKGWTKDLKVCNRQLIHLTMVILTGKCAKGTNGICSNGNCQKMKFVRKQIDKVKNLKVEFLRWEEQTVKLDVRRALIERLHPSTAYYFHVKLTRDEKHQV